jgi:GNAT superfamily N-acetyltransferase
VWEIRPATLEDADGLAAVVHEGFASYRDFAPKGWQPPDLLELALGIALRLRGGEQRTWLAEEDGRIVAEVAYLPAARSRKPVDDPQLAHLVQLFVARSHWGSGVAAELHELALRHAAGDGYTRMRLWTPADHARGRRFYEREGWEVVAGDEGLPDDRLGLELVEFRRTLLPAGSDSHVSA